MAFIFFGISYDLPQIINDCLLNLNLYFYKTKKTFFFFNQVLFEFFMNEKRQEKSYPP